VLALHIIIWLWFTILFANFAESIAEVQGKARADSLRKMRKSVSPTAGWTTAGWKTSVWKSLKRTMRLYAGQATLFPGRGSDRGIASVDESAITGESAPVIRESGGDRSAVTGGTRVISDRIVIRLTSEPGNTFIDRIISLVESSIRRKTPNEIALTILLAPSRSYFS